MKTLIRYFCAFLCLACAVPTFGADRTANFARSESRRKLPSMRVSMRPHGQQAPRAKGFIQREPEEGSSLERRHGSTSLYDEDNLYFAVIAKDSEAGRIIVSELKKDFNVDNGDSFQIVLDTFTTSATPINSRSIQPGKVGTRK